MEWRQCLDIGTEEDSIHQLDRAVQVTIFRLRTGYCQLLSHLHRLKIFHSDECPCGTGPQTPNHILQSCPTFDALNPQEALGTGRDTAADCRLCLTDWTEDLAEPGTQRKKESHMQKSLQISGPQCCGWGMKGQEQE